MSKFVGTWCPVVWISATGNVRDAKDQIATLTFYPDGTGTTSLKKLIRTKKDKFIWNDSDIPSFLKAQSSAEEICDVSLVFKSSCCVMPFYRCFYHSNPEAMIAFFDKDVPNMAGAKVIYKRLSK